MPESTGVVPAREMNLNSVLWFEERKRRGALVFPHSVTPMILARRFERDNGG
jgi:hypothetical protein